MCSMSDVFPGQALMHWLNMELVMWMTLAELRQFSLSAGFKILELFEHGASWDGVDQTIFSQCKALYPSLTVSDLITSNVLIMLRKPP